MSVAVLDNWRKSLAPAPLAPFMAYTYLTGAQLPPERTPLPFWGPGHCGTCAGPFALSVVSALDLYRFRARDRSIQ